MPQPPGRQRRARSAPVIPPLYGKNRGFEPSALSAVAGPATVCAGDRRGRTIRRRAARGNRWLPPADPAKPTPRRDRTGDGQPVPRPGCRGRLHAPTGAVARLRRVAARARASRPKRGVAPAIVPLSRAAGPPCGGSGRRSPLCRRPGAGRPLATRWPGAVRWRRGAGETGPAGSGPVRPTRRQRRSPAGRIRPAETGEATSASETGNDKVCVGGLPAQVSQAGIETPGAGAARRAIVTPPGARIMARLSVRRAMA